MEDRDFKTLCLLGHNMFTLSSIKRLSQLRVLSSRFLFLSTFGVDVVRANYSSIFLYMCIYFISGYNDNVFLPCSDTVFHCNLFC